METPSVALQNRSIGLKKKHATGYKVWNAGQSKATNPILQAKSLRAKKLGTYSKVTRPPIQEQGRLALSASMKGNVNSQVMKTEEKRRSLAILRSSELCKSGETIKERHDRLLTCDLQSLRKEHTRDEILAMLQISNGAYQRFLRAHGFTPSKEVCLLCK